MRKLRILAAFMLVLFLSQPAWAVFYEKDMKTTLSILLQELRQTQEKFRAFNTAQRPSNQQQSRQRGNMRVNVEELTEQCNALALMLYSQSSYNFTFDLTYALDQVSKQYNEFNTKLQPYEMRLSMMMAGLDRYTRLDNTLRNIPENPEYDAVLDSCLIVVEQMADFYSQGLERLETDSKRYIALKTQLDEAYEYAQKSYEDVQQRIFFRGQPSLLKMLERRDFYFPLLRQEVVEKYGSTDTSNLISGRVWSGSTLLLFGLMTLVILIGCFLLIC